MTLSSEIENQYQSYSIRATSKNITEIDYVPPRFLNCSVLWLSYNSIQSLKNVDQFSSLNRLLIEYNNICWIEDLYPLKSLQDLYELRLEGNPVCRLPIWIFHVLNICKNLKNLNGKIVRKLSDDQSELIFTKTYENLDIPRILSIEHDLLKSLFYNEASNQVVQKMKKWKGKLTLPKKLEIMQAELNDKNKQQFINTIRTKSPSQDLSGYFLYLKGRLLKNFNLFQKNFPHSESNDQIFQSHSEIIKAMKKFAQEPGNFDVFSQLSLLSTSYELQSIGVNADKELTDHLNSHCQESIELSNLMNTITIDDILQNKRNLSYHPVLLIGSEKENDVSLNEYNPKLHTVSGFEFELVEEDLQQFLNAINEPSSDDSDEEQLREKGLTFEHQMNTEITESEAFSHSQNRSKDQDDPLSSDSFHQKQQILTTNPTIKTLPISEIYGSDTPTISACLMDSSSRIKSERK